MGDVLVVLEERDGWYRVEMYDGYQGWADPGDIALYDQEAYDAYFGGPVVLVTAKTVSLMTPESNGVPKAELEIVQGSVLPTTGERGQDNVVVLPDGREGLIPTPAVKKFNRKEDVFAEKKDAKAVIDTAMQYVGVPYLWGGTTAYGFDCSGLTQFAYHMNGYNISGTLTCNTNRGSLLMISQTWSRAIGVFRNLRGRGFTCRHLHRRSPVCSSRQFQWG
jgi:hypothetical protein